LEGQGKMDAALRHFEAAVQLAPHIASVLFNFASALYERGQIDAAMQRFHEAIRLNPDLEPAVNKYKRDVKQPLHDIRT